MPKGVFKKSGLILGMASISMAILGMVVGFGLNQYFNAYQNNRLYNSYSNKTTSISNAIYSMQSAEVTGQIISVNGSTITIKPDNFNSTEDLILSPHIAVEPSLSTSSFGNYKLPINTDVRINLTFVNGVFTVVSIDKTG